MVASSVILIYLGYGSKTLKETFNMEIMRKNEAIGAIAYSFFALIGIIYGANFCRNVIFNHGKIGDLYSSGTIFWMNFSVGYKVLTGVGFLILLMVGLLSFDGDIKNH